MRVYQTIGCATDFVLDTGTEFLFSIHWLNRVTDLLALPYLALTGGSSLEYVEVHMQAAILAKLARHTAMQGVREWVQDNGHKWNLDTLAPVQCHEGWASPAATTRNKRRCFTGVTIRFVDPNLAMRFKIAFVGV